MEAANPLAPMEDRIVDLLAIPEEAIRQQGFGWYFNEENEGYFYPELIRIFVDESKDLKAAARNLYQVFCTGLDHMIQHNNWHKIDIPEQAIPIIKYSWQRKHTHLLGRFDFAGGIGPLPIKLLEFNADTPTMLPESSIIQDLLVKNYPMRNKGQLNNLEADLKDSLAKIKHFNRNRNPTMLFSSLGFEEDVLNVRIIEKAAQAAGFKTAYSDLEHVIFSAEEGIFLETEQGYQPFDFFYKLVPWEFVIYEEPELLNLLTDIVTNDLGYVLNPAYTVVFQNKAFMAYLYELFPNNEYLLETYFGKGNFSGRSYVEKVIYGREGENISIMDTTGKLSAGNDGDFGDYPSIEQKFTDLYKDDDGNYYQGGVYYTNNQVSCLSFRRRDDLIIDEDSEFIPHLLF